MYGNTSGVSETIPVGALDSLNSALKDLSGRVSGLEKDRRPSIGNTDNILPEIERATLLTERLDRDVQAIQREMDELRKQVQTLSVKLGGGERGGDSPKEGRKECANADLAVLDSNQVCVSCRSRGVSWKPPLDPPHAEVANYRLTFSPWR